MPDFIYDKKSRKLTGHGETWEVRSGIPGEYTPTPNGLDTVPPGALMSGQAGLGVPHDPKYAKAPFAYRDKKGFSWFFWLGKGDLGIHPDGNVPGTKGCIGIVEADTRPLFNKLKSLSQRQITVQVQ